MNSPYAHKFSAFRYLTPFTLAILLAIPLVFGGTPARAGTLSLAEYYRPFVKTTDREFLAFSYQKRGYGVSEKGELSAQDRAYLPDFLGKLAARFTAPDHPESKKDTIGLYLANDPVVSRSWGGDDYLLFSFRVPKGVKTLDLDAASAPDKFPAEWLAKLTAAHCPIDGIERLIRQSTRDANCRAIALQTLEDLGASMIEYGWLSESFAGCDPRSHSKAFIVLDSGIFGQADIRAHASESKALNAEEEKERELIAGSFRTSTNPNGLGPDQLEARKLWPELSEKTPDAELQAWMDENLLGCAD